MITPTHTCPEIGEWRAWLDQEASADLDAHLTTCAGCQAVVAELRDTTAFATTRLEMLASLAPNAAETALARERLERRKTGALATPSPVREPVAIAGWRRFSTPWRVAGTGVAAAIALTLVVALTPEGQIAAAGFLAQFRSQQVAAIEVSPQSQADIARTLDTLRNLGTIQTPAGTANGRPETTARNLANRAQTATLAEANKTLGFPLQTPDPAALPAGLDKTPTVRVMPATQIRFTLERDKARAYLQSTGHANVTIPDKFDGATLVVSIPSGTLLQYSGPSSRSTLIVGQSGELVVDVEGKVSLDEMRDLLLSLPGLPPATVNQLKQIKNWNQTLPIPVPVDVVNWQSATFKNKYQGLLLDDNSGVASAAIWHEDGHLVGLAGSLKAKDLQRVAETLAVR